MFHFRLIKQNKVLIFVFALAVGLISGFLIAANLNLLPQSKAEGKTALSSAAPRGGQENEVEEVENSFVKVASTVGPAVVSISTEHTEKVKRGIRRYYFGPEGPSSGQDEFFDQFFRDFFGQNLPGLPHEYKQMGLGSGVIIDDEGYILTNEHVIQNADKIAITLPDGREFKGEVKGTDPRSDLAIVKIKAHNLPVAELGDSDKVRIGQWAIAIGNPFGFAVNNPKPTVTVGVISALDRSLPRTGQRDRDYSGLIQTDAAINPGNSGGPLVDISGKIVGINVAIFTTSGGYEGVGFAIPINIAKEIVGDLIAGKKILYGWLGVNVQDLDEDLIKYFNLSDKEGVLIAKVLEDSPAQKGGLKDSDIIRSYNGEKIKNVRELLKRVGRSKVGQKVKVGIVRGGKEITVEVEVGERPSELEKFAEASTGNWRGIEVKDITPELAKRFNLEEKSGVMISNIENGTPADNAGLRVGDVINEINKRPIKNMKDYEIAIKDLKGDVLLRTARGYAIIKEKVE